MKYRETTTTTIEETTTIAKTTTVVIEIMATETETTTKAKDPSQTALRVLLSIQVFQYLCPKNKNEDKPQKTRKIPFFCELG